MGEWVFCDYDEIEIDYLKQEQYGGKKWAVSTIKKWEIRKWWIISTSYFPWGEKRDIDSMWKFYYCYGHICAYVRSAFSDYKPCLCNRKTFLRMGGKLWVNN